MKIQHQKATIALTALLCAASISLSVYAAPAKTDASTAKPAATPAADKEDDKDAAKENKESKESKEAKDSNESKESKDSKETKEAKDSKDSKETKESGEKGKATAEKGKAGEKTVKAAPELPIPDVQNVTTDQLTEKPHDYLNKNVRFSGIFASFSTLPLDYKPAMRPAKTHVGLLIYRSNSKIPYSEIKIAMPMPKEKEPENAVLMGLHDGDTIEITGKVFATPLDEPWLDVLRLKKTASAPEDKKTKEEKEKEKAEAPTVPDSTKSKNSKLEQKAKPYEKANPEVQEQK